MFRVYLHPIDALSRYIFNIGNYPVKIGINTPEGVIDINIYSHDDILTVNEIFCRIDYPTKKQDLVIVDFGSNIGISGAYFLTCAPNSFVYLYEPLQINIDRLRDNLRQFEGRYALHEIAVGRVDGEVEFGWENTGRYGGIGMETGKYILVACQDSNKILEEIVMRHGRIDILKIDTETLEQQLTERIPVALAKKIDRIYVEYVFDSNPLEQTHHRRQYGYITQFVNRDALGYEGNAAALPPP